MKPMITNLDNIYYTKTRDEIEDKYKRMKNLKDKEIIH